MSSKKKTPAAPSTHRQALKIGSRVRCTDDSVAGRIVWANGTSVKIQWDDGEQVTWRRDTLAGKPIEILDTTAARNERHPTEAPAEVTASEQGVVTALPQTEQEETPGMVEQVPAMEVSAESTPQALEHSQTAAQVFVPEPASPTPEQREVAAADNAPMLSAPATPKRQRKVSGESRERKRSALDAAVQVLAEEGRAMTCQEMIEVMAAKGYWTSPKGATPQSTLYSAILRELTAKGNAARFQKVERGKFACNAET